MRIKKSIVILSMLFSCLCENMDVVCAAAQADSAVSEHIILIGPKTIGGGWKDNIVVLPQQFADTKVGDIIRVYTATAKSFAQGCFQNPKDWKPVAPEYAYFNIGRTFSLTVTDSILPQLCEHGLAIGGHDYVIGKVTHVPAALISEKTLWRGPSVIMRNDWSVSAPVRKDFLKGLQKGDVLHFQVSRVAKGAAIKVMNFTYQAFSKDVDGVPIGADGLFYPIEDDAQLAALQIAGNDGTVMRVGGKDYRLDKISVIRQQGGIDPDVSHAQRAPKEYALQLGQLFYGEKVLPSDNSGYLALTAERMQDLTAEDCLVISYKGSQQGARLSFRENKGGWPDLSGSKQPAWYSLDGNDVVLTLDEAMLDRLMTSGMVITGGGTTLTRVSILKVQ